MISQDLQIKDNPDKTAAINSSHSITKSSRMSSRITSRTSRNTSRTAKSLLLLNKRTEFDNYYSRHFLRDLKRSFDEADKENKGYLTLEQWESSKLRQFLQDGKLNDEDYRKYFMRIDANNDGIIDWNELVIYLSQEISVRELHIDKGTIQFIRKPKLPPPSRSQMHREMVQYISVCYLTGEYVTMSSDSIRFWNPTNLSFKRSITEPGNFRNFCIFDSLKLIAVATTKRQLLFYDLETLSKLPVEASASPNPKSIRKMSISDAKEALETLDDPQMPLGNIPQTICDAEPVEKPSGKPSETSSEKPSDKLSGKPLEKLSEKPSGKPSVSNENTKLFFVGDDAGIVEAFKIKVPMRRRGTDYEVIRICRSVMHRGGINRIKPIATLKCFASCSNDQSVKFWSFFESHAKSGGSFTVLRTFNDTNGPILGFNFSPAQKIIVTYGITRDAYVWAISPPRKLFKLGGHYNAIQSIADFVTSNDEKYVVTITNKKEFRLWDSVNFRLVHEWNDNEMQRPENHYSASFFDIGRHSLITCSSYPSKWTEDASAQADFYETLSHAHPIVGTFYTRAFDEIVTIDCVSTIKVWNYKDGSLIFAHKNNFDKSEVTDRSNSDILSESCIDTSGRRILTSSFNRQTKMWNFNSGTEITILNLTEPTSFVTYMKCVTINGRDYYARACWDRNVMLFMETEKGSFDPYRVFSGHKSDISALTEFSDGILSGDVSGELFEWVLETNTPKEKFKLDASIECMKVVGHYLFVGDGRGQLHVFSLPKLTLVQSVNAHGIVKPYILSAIEVDTENGFLYTGDTFGYVKKWKVSFEPIFTFESTVESSTIKRCSLEEIKRIIVVGCGRFFVTESNDRIVRLWSSPIDGSSDISYVGFFSDMNHVKAKNHQDNGWNIFDMAPRSDPFEVDPKHFQIVKTVSERSSQYQKLIARSASNMLSQVSLPRISTSTSGLPHISSIEEIPSAEMSSDASFIVPIEQESIVVAEEEEKKEEAAFSFTRAGEMIDDFLRDEEYKKNRPVLPPEMEQMLTNGDVLSSRTIFNITQPDKPFRLPQLTTSTRPIDLINRYMALKKRPVPSGPEFFDTKKNYAKKFSETSASLHLDNERNSTRISALTRPIFRPRSGRRLRVSASAASKRPTYAEFMD